MSERVARRIGKYKIVSMLGSGGFGTVYLVEHNETKLALKQLESGIMNPEVSKRFILESKKIEELRERYNIEYIIQILDILYEHNAYVMEYVPEGSEEYFSRKKDVGFIIYLIQAIHQLHRLNVVHRDIKPKNLRVKNSLPSIIDFGASSWWDSRSSSTEMGARFYSPPEVVVNIFNEYKDLNAARNANSELVKIKPDNAFERFKYIKKLHDVYSLGITIGELLTGTIPFTSDSYKEYLHTAKSGDFTTWLASIPPMFRGFVEKAATFSPLQRPQLDDLIKLFNITPFDFIYHEAERDDDTYWAEGYVKCLNCSEETLPPADHCPTCHEELTTVMLHIDPMQNIKLRDSPGVMQLMRNPGINEDNLSLVIDLKGKDFEIDVGRNSQLCHVSFPDDNAMANVQGTLIKEKGKIHYIDGKDGLQPTNPGLFNNFPVGNSKIELSSGSSLLLGSTVLKTLKYFGKIR